MKFSLKRSEIPITIEGTDGIERKFVLREVDGLERDEYSSKMAAKARYDEKGKIVGLKDQVGLVAALIHLSLYDEAGTRVALQVIEKFPSKMQMALFTAAQQLSGLVEDKQSAGND